MSSSYSSLLSAAIRLVDRVAAGDRDPHPQDRRLHQHQENPPHRRVHRLKKVRRRRPQLDHQMLPQRSKRRVRRLHLVHRQRRSRFGRQRRRPCPAHVARPRRQAGAVAVVRRRQYHGGDRLQVAHVRREEAHHEEGELERSENLLKDDCFTVRCDLTVMDEAVLTEKLDEQEILAPAADADAHAMDAGAFKALLHFIYTDTLPEAKKGEEDAAAMVRQLLAAADRYKMERLKLICEDKLRGRIGMDNVAVTLAMAEQHHCRVLKDACLEFLASPGNLKAAMATDGFEHLKKTCPSVLLELVMKQQFA